MTSVNDIGEPFISDSSRFRCPAGTLPYFSSDQWLGPWKRSYARSDDCFVTSPVDLRTQNDTKATVLLPLMIRRERIARIPVRVMRFMGTGDAEEEEVCTEFPDIAVSAPDIMDDAGQIHRYLAANYQWDLYRLEHVLPGSLVARMMSCLGAFRRPAGWRYSIAMEGDFAAWVNQLGKSTRSKVRRTLKSAEQEDLHLVWHDTPESLEDGLDALRLLHGKRWQSKGEKGVFSSPRFVEFHRALVSNPRSCARVALLKRENEVLSAWYGFDHGGVRYFYQSGFDPLYSSLSPGLAIHLLVIQDAFKRGIQCYDFMKGADRSYKQHLATRRTPVFHYVAPGPSLVGWLSRAILAQRSGWYAVRE